MASPNALASGAALALLVMVIIVARSTPIASHARSVLVIDCGSSGTRMYAYRLEKPRGRGVMRVESIHPSAAASLIPRKVGKSLYNRVETQPGVDQFVGDDQGLADQALGPLLAWARAVVPASMHRRTPVFLLATAGIRKLPQDGQGRLLDSVRRLLAESGFRFEPDWARIISGVDEGVYGWVAMNYLRGSLEGILDGLQQAGPGQEAENDGAEQLLSGTLQDRLTVGALDLGGSSLEVTTASSKSSASSAAGTELSAVSVLGIQFRLRTTSLKGVGLNDVFDRSVALLLHRQLQRQQQASQKQTERLMDMQAGTGEGAVAGAQHGPTPGAQSAVDAPAGNQPLLPPRAASLAEATRAPGQSPSLATAPRSVLESSMSQASTRPLEGSGGGGGAPAQIAASGGPVPGGSWVTPSGDSGTAGGLNRRSVVVVSERSPQPASQSTVSHAAALSSLEELRHPCMHAGYSSAYKRLLDYGIATSHREVLLVGSADFEACSALVAELVRESEPCIESPCTSGLSSEALHQGRRFIALSGFYVVWKFFGLDSDAPMQKVLQRSRAFCGRPWSAVRAELGENVNVERYCLWGPYVVELLQSGLRLSQAQIEIGGGDFSWTLGAALVESGRLPELGGLPVSARGRTGRAEATGSSAAAAAAGLAPWANAGQLREAVGWGSLVFAGVLLAVCAAAATTRALLRRRAREQLQQLLLSGSGWDGGRFATRPQPIGRAKSRSNMSSW